MEELIRQLIEKRAKHAEKRDATLDAAKKESRGLTSDEVADVESRNEKIAKLDNRIAELDEQIKREKTAKKAEKRYGLGLTGGHAQVTDAPVYTERSSMSFGPSFFRDLSSVKNGDREAYDRLTRNNKHVFDVDPERRAISTTTGAGGEFVPPLWLENQWIKFTRPGRVFVDQCNVLPLPPGTNSINVPKVATGTAVAAQATQNTGVQQTDLTTTSVSTPVQTISGGQTVSMQLLEQSPLAIDQVVLQDLAADYATKFATAVVNGPGTGGTLTGVLNVSGVTTIAWTTGSPALSGAGQLFPLIAKAIQTMHTTRYAPPTHIFMHPRRWAWAVAQADSSNRPLVLPIAGGNQAFNAMGTQSAVLPQGFVGQILGVNVYVDPNLPITLNANQDPIIVAKLDDVSVYESNLRLEAFNQTYANQLSLFVRAYNYVGAIVRYAPSIQPIYGTGSTTPTF